MNFDERFTCLQILEKKKKKNMEGGNECVCTHKKKDYNAWHEDLFLFNFQNKIKHMVTLSLNSLPL